MSGVSVDAASAKRLRPPPSDSAAAAHAAPGVDQPPPQVAPRSGPAAVARISRADIALTPRELRRGTHALAAQHAADAAAVSAVSAGAGAGSACGSAVVHATVVDVGTDRRDAYERDARVAEWLKSAASELVCRFDKGAWCSLWRSTACTRVACVPEPYTLAGVLGYRGLPRGLQQTTAPQTVEDAAAYLDARLAAAGEGAGSVTRRDLHMVTTLSLRSYELQHVGTVPVAAALRRMPALTSLDLYCAWVGVGDQV